MLCVVLYLQVYSQLVQCIVYAVCSTIPAGVQPVSTVYCVCCVLCMLCVVLYLRVDGDGTLVRVVLWIHHRLYLGG
jgi:hypothetical protein